MSFGTSVRGAQPGASKKPVVFWDQQTMEANKRKPTKSNKFVKEQKFPLRGKKEPVAAAPPPNRRVPNPRKKDSEITPGVVTLTQAQLDAILSTVGTLVTQNEELQKSHNLKDLQIGDDDGYNGQAESPQDILRLVDSSRKTKAKSPQNNGTVEPGEVPGLGSISGTVEPREIPGLGAVGGYSNTYEPSIPGLDGGRTLAPSAIPGLGSVDAPPPPASIPKAHMSKAELKRLQWEQERVDGEGASSKGIENSPLMGIGTRKPPNRLAELKPSTPRAHLTKAERRRRESEAARNMPLSPGRTLTEFWSNEPHKVAVSPSANDQPPGIPRAHLSKAELKRQQWDQERVENDARTRQQNQPTYQSKSPMTSDPVQRNAPPPGSKAEQKRLQWERERAENEAREAMAKGQAYNQRQTNNQVSSPNVTHLPPSGGGGVPKGHLSKAELKRLQWEKERAEEQGGGQPWLGSPQQTTNYQRPPQDSSPAPFLPKPVMSKSELKRLQWEKERKELQKEEQQEFSPWGRPGAGAPIRDASGNVLSDYNQRQDDADVQNSQQNLTTGQAAVPSPQQPEIIRQERHNRVNVNAAVTPTVDYSQPAAIRSSFVIGGAAPDVDRFTSVKEREKRAWLDELERQMEEKRQAKEREKEKWRQEEDTWADRFVPPPDKALSNRAPPEEIRISSAPQVAPSAVPGIDFDPQPPLDLRGSQSMNGGLSHLRGQNRMVDDKTRQEQDEKRQRQLAHQEAVKAQVDEHKRKKAEERERRAREEQEEEQRLQKERDALQAVFEQERLKAKEKEEQQQRRVQSLKEAMDASAEQANREKHERRMRKLQQGGHDTSMINANFEEPLGMPEASSFTIAPGAVTESQPVSAKMTPRVLPSGLQAAPTSIPGLDLTPRDIVVASSMTHEPYQQDKVIVPTKYKGGPSQPFSDPMSPRREFGVQTELELSGIQNLNLNSGRQNLNLSRESTTDIEYKGPFKDNTKKVRIKSTEKTQEIKKGPKKVAERPRWGGGAATKKHVKQSEKDPLFEKKKQQREAQRLQRQQDMLDMAERTMARAKQKTTTSFRTRSKSRERNVEDERGQGQGRGQGRGRGQPDPRSRSLAGSRRTSSPPVPVLRTRSNPQSPPVPALQQKRAPSPENSRGAASHRSRIDTHRSQGQKRTPREAQENQPPVVNGYRSSSPPIPTLRKQLDADSDKPLNSYRSNSPPIPTVKHRIENEYNIDAHAFEGGKPSNLKQDSQRHKYKDSDPLAPPKPDGDFVPFIRTANILDPQVAEEPLPLSREATAVEKARKAYVHGIQPANYGMKMSNYEDRELSEAIAEMPQMPEAEWKKDPIMNPSLVTGHPTGRQDRILQQLSDLRRGLMQKQRELEVGSPMMD